MINWVRGWRKGLALLEPKERRRMRRLLLLLVFAAVCESASVAAVLPFLELAADSSALSRRPVLAAAASSLGAATHGEALFLFGMATLGLLVTGNAAAALAQVRSARLSWGTYRRLGHRLLAAYLDAPYIVHLERSPPDLVHGVMGETLIFVSGWMLPSLQLISRSLIVIFLVGTLMMVEPVAALLALVVLGGAYAAILTSARRRLDSLGQVREGANQRLHRTVTEAFAAFRDVRMHETARTVEAKFGRDARDFTRAMASVHAISVLPKYAVEVLAMGSVVGLAVGMAAADKSQASTIGFLGLFAIAGYRLVPALQTCFQCAATMRFAAPARDRLMRDLTTIRRSASEHLPANGPARIPRREFGLEHVTFRYPGAGSPVLRDVSLTVRMGATTVILGPTGSGKSTVLDLLLGLTEAGSGCLRADGVELGTAELRPWRRNFAYVSQAPVLLDASVAENIAFGVAPAQIDMPRVRAAAHAACIDEYVQMHLPKAYEAEIGDRGTRLSGGQRQRIAIARALYTRRPILVLDEATSALDESIEQELFRRLKQYDPRMTLVCVTHRSVRALDPDDVLTVQHEGSVASRSNAS